MTPESGQADDEQRLAAEALERVRAGVRQRQAEAALAGVEAARAHLAELRTLEYVEEPLPVSPRPVVGPVLVFLRKGFFHVLFKWWARPVLQRQNRLNQVASQLLHEIARGQERLAEDLAAAERSLAEMEGRRAADGGRRPGGGEPS